MRFCQPHWDRLYDRIREMSLEHLVANSQEEAIEGLVAHMEGTGTPEQYDPLLDAHNKIMSNALEQGGLYLMQVEDGRHLCPLCELNKNASDGDKFEGQVPSDVWIAFATNEVLETCISKGLISRS